MESKRKVHITRLDFDVEFKDIIGRIDGEDNKDCEELIKMLSSVNNRQKLKIMKKCIDSEQPNELMKKSKYYLI